MHAHRPRSRQRGISLFIVLVMVLLSTLLVLGSSRTALIGEMAAGHDSDHERALEAAHAMLRDAEFDITGEHPDGSPCEASACRPRGVLDASAGKVSFPTTAGELLDLQAALGAMSPSCATAICVADKVPAQFWTDRKTLDIMKKVGASYGAYTGANASDTGNPLLASGAGQRAWYWVEVLPYETTAAIAGGLAEDLAPDSTTPYVYRITAIAQGLRAATQTVLQTTLVRKKRKS
ncbi:pilus assembly protein PilX [Variovorax sp. J2P1-59]|uniref:pilus assembly PilX family protein n=1 Tax=Variovorax flavidus TaxID=3053501 RepID=UPI0025791075|nr:pilus assembly protein PilX [Variovorax sp. J2P1-59]MDM0072858.1 pilus assembly protein PilX [Variovorax sp. J2P1-59]